MNSSDETSRRRSILVVDDELGYRDLFRCLLEPLGFSVFSAPDGPACLELVRQRDFDMIFLDIHIPKSSGHEVLRNIREIKPHQRVVVMSSSSDPTHRFGERAQELRVSGCLYKPFDVDQLLNAVEEFGG